MKISVITAIVVSLMCLSSADATIINVPVDQTTIQAGIDASVNGDTVLVQPGLYVENINFNGHSIVLGSLFLTTGDTSYIDSTIIDGNSLESVVIIEDLLTVPFPAVIGFTIRNGYTEINGGGIRCVNSNALISHNFITMNSTGPNLSQPVKRGGGIYCSHGEPIITYNKITENTAKAGAGMSCVSGSPTISYNTILSNTTAINGIGGGIECFDVQASMIISHNIINNNFASSDGGGINAAGYGTISDNVLIGNRSEGTWGYGGGAIMCANEDVLNNIIIGNTTTYSGGGIWGGDGLISNNVIVGNSGYKGGGIFILGIPILDNNTIYGNSAYETGGGLYFHSFLNCQVKNTICWNNNPNNVDKWESNSSIVTYCDIEGGWEGEGNIDRDPMFCDPAENDFHIADVSCCLGAGEGGVDIGALGVGCYAIEYLTGDVNMYGGAWPPSSTGPDVTYLVNYFRSLPTSHACLLDGFWASADANGDCDVIGSDVTRLVNVFRGIGNIGYCPSYPPMWLISGDLPDEAPEGWPGCE